MARAGQAVSRHAHAYKIAGHKLCASVNQRVETGLSKQIVEIHPAAEVYVTHERRLGARSCSDSGSLLHVYNRSSACDVRMLKDHCIAGGQYRNQPGDGKELC